jgi:hypothetical protein
MKMLYEDVRFIVAMDMKSPQKRCLKSEAVAGC